MGDVSTWGEVVPSWLEALATAGALGAATYAGIVARRLYAVESQRDRRILEDEERAQAEKVAAWISTESHPDVKVKVMQGVTAYPWHTALRNASDVPVYDVILVFRVGDDTSIGTDSVPVLPPATEPLRRPLPDQVRPHLPKDAHSQPMYVLITFTDSAERQWTRGYDGKLRRREVGDQSELRRPSRARRLLRWLLRRSDDQPRERR